MGQAEAAVASAQGEAEANQVRVASVSPQLIDYLRWQRWDNRFPMVTSSNASRFVSISSEATPTPTH